MLTKEQCDYIVERNNSFYRKDMTVDGVNVAVFNYRMASLGDFTNPTNAQTKSHVLKAFEMRGLTFTQEPSGEWKRWLMLSKFFNVGETLGWMPDELEAKPLRSVYEKLDGSLIHFVLIGNKWVAKTKQVFDNEQAQAANEILERTPELCAFLEFCEMSGLTPLFEYTAPTNRIVLAYPVEQLTLIQVRCTTTGAYYDPDLFTDRGIPVVQPFIETEWSFDAIRNWVGSATGVEGVVLNCDGQLAKWKTDWYFQQHRAKDMLGRSDRFLLELVLSNCFDDAVASLDESMSDLRAEVEAKAKLIRDHFNNHAAIVERLIQNYPKAESRKAFYMANDAYPYIGTVMASLDGRDFEPGLTQAILRRFGTSDDVRKGLLA